jgi:hypothetical protein
MRDRSNTDVDKLHALMAEMDKTLYGLSPGGNTISVASQLPKIKQDVDQLQDLVIELAKVIYPLTPSSYLKGVVNSVLDTISVDDALDDLKIYNKQPASKIRNNQKKSWFRLYYEVQINLA